MSVASIGIRVGRFIRRSMGRWGSTSNLLPDQPVPQATLPGEPWVLQELKISDDLVEITGWILPPPGSDSNHCRFLLNGQSFEEVQYPQHHAGVEHVLWGRLNAGQSGFVCRTRNLPQPLYPDGVLTLQIDHPRRQVPLRCQDAYYVPDPRTRKALPDDARLIRVAGEARPEAFCFGGLTDFMRMDLLLESLFGRGFAGFPRVLDWGCGCGRVIRYMDRVSGVSATGADVDPDNIAWCRANLPHASYAHLPLHPPTSFAPASFDLIYGISVFTHLREKVQFAWLEELQRIAAPGAVLLMTVHGETALQYCRAPRSLLECLSRDGFVVTSENPQINDVIDDRTYYVNTAHDPGYLRAKWGRYFNVLRIIPGFLGTQDVVVMQKA
jgi:SAM-dependent methyltransferase